MHIPRILHQAVRQRLAPEKVVLLIGARQTGKSTLLREVEREYRAAGRKVLHLDCDDAAVRMRLEIQQMPNLQNLVGDTELLIIDEAQRVKNIGLTLKILVDQVKTPHILVSGSSALELSNEINEPLTGRKWELTMPPISVAELTAFHGVFEEERRLEQRLLYGLYPEIVTNSGMERPLLQQLTSSYLYKDVFNFKELRKPELLDRLLKVLALQIGSEASYNSIAAAVTSDIATVQRYIELLEKAFIIFRLPAFSRNVRNELKRSRKIYFWDLGVRNALVGDFRPIAARNDIGALWENFLVSERFKYNLHREFYGHAYFWRTAQQQEVDYLEDIDGQLHAFEFKWSINKGASLPLTFKNAYPGSSFEVVRPDNYLSFTAPAPRGN
jgi:uncharacterized protein